ncbi:MAG: hypothetical protein KGI71_04890 [Patescibacteria group bacterium]|nr:hypothetical protein [Patescibacteria group bacterium]
MDPDDLVDPYASTLPPSAAPTTIPPSGIPAALHSLRVPPPLDFDGFASDALDDSEEG